MDKKTAKKSKGEKIEVDDFILLTESNRKELIKIGVVVFLIENKKIMSRLYIRPRLEKGKTISAVGDPGIKEELKIHNGESHQEYISNFKPILDKVISEKIAYIKKNQKLIQYKIR